MKEKKWVCNKCGHEVYEKPTSRNTTCSECGRGRFRYFALCKCGTWFHPNRTTQAYCSKECGYSFRKSDGKKGKHYPHLRRAKIKVCKACGKEYRAVNDFRGRESKYCSDKCRLTRGKKLNFCKECGVKIETTESIDKKYCSDECRRIAYAKRTGEKSPAWKGGKTERMKRIQGSMEYKKWRRAVFKRDDFTCQECGERGGKLEAHHVKGKAKHPELMFDVSNGLTLCHSCHVKTDNYGAKAVR